MTYARKTLSSDRANALAKRPPAAPPLLEFQPSASTKAIAFKLRDYLDLVDCTGRVQRAAKRGAIDRARPAIMVRLNLNEHAWRAAMRPQGNVFGRALGRLDHLRLHARTLGQSWIRGVRQAERAFG